MLLLLTHESHTATLRSESQAVARVVYDDLTILDAKIRSFSEFCKFYGEKQYQAYKYRTKFNKKEKSNVIIARFFVHLRDFCHSGNINNNLK